jgi:glucose/arabinose dehydrogenase
VFGPDGHLYVSSFDTILRYDGLTGAFRDIFVEDARIVDLLFGPDGHLYVADNSFDGGILRYDGRTGAFLNTFVSNGSGGLFDPRGLVFGPDGHLYVSSSTFSSDAILRYDGRTGAFLNTFVPAESGGLLSPSGLMFGPDGHLYVIDALDTILRYDGVRGVPLPASGQSGAVFVSRGSGGLRSPRGLVFGPDNQLYVSSADNSAILRYEGRTGAFLNTFVLPGSGGLLSPAGLVFFLP